MIQFHRWGLWLTLFGCLEPETLYKVDLTGTVISDQTGPVELWFMHTQWGEQQLQTSHMIFDSTWLDGSGDFTHQLQVPQGAGEGLSIYGWQDVDEDGEHCRPGGNPEPSGLVEESAYPAHEIEIEIELDSTCEGPERLADGAPLDQNSNEPLES